jgi:hypothetical protein
MLFWVLTETGQVTEPREWDGWKTMEECETAAESFTEANPKLRNTYRYAIVAQCVEVPK